MSDRQNEVVKTTNVAYAVLGVVKNVVKKHRKRMEGLFWIVQESTEISLQSYEINRGKWYNIVILVGMGENVEPLEFRSRFFFMDQQKLFVIRCDRSIYNSTTGGKVPVQIG